MSYRLEWIFQYRLLLSKATELHIALSPAEQARLQRLRAQLSGQLPEPGGTAAQTGLLQAPLPAQYVHCGRFHSASVRSATGGGLVLHTEQPPPAGQHLQLHVWDPSHSTEYTFPVRVIDRAGNGIRVGFEGLPVQTSLMSSQLGLRPSASKLSLSSR